MVNRLPVTRHATREELTMQRALSVPYPARFRARLGSASSSTRGWFASTRDFCSTFVN